MGKWRAKVRSFDRCTRCRRTSPPQASDAFSSVRREGSEGGRQQHNTRLGCAPVLTLGWRLLGKRRKVNRRPTDGRVVSFSLPPSLFLRILIPRRISPLISPFPIVLRAPPFLSPVVPPVSSSYSAFAVDGGPREEREEGKRGERERRALKPKRNCCRLTDTAAHPPPDAVVVVVFALWNRVQGEEHGSSTAPNLIPRRVR